jgi:hypothetical protein
MILIVIKLKQLIPQETKKVLLEITMEQAEARFGSKAFLMAVERRKELVREKFGSRYSKEEIKKLILRQTPEQAKIVFLREYLPEPPDISEKSQAEALNWLITAFIKDPFFATKSIKEDLETFYQIKEAKVDRILPKKNIYDIANGKELKDIIEEAKPAWEKHKKDKSDADAAAGTNKIYEDDNWEVFIPENKGAACKLGKGTDWCTASPGLDYYNKYHKPEEGDPLIIFYSKKESFKRKVKEYNKKTKTWDLVQKTFPKKYQFSYGSDQFMDWKKPERSIKENPLFYKLNQIVKSLTDKLPEQVIKKADQWSYEELPDGGYKVSVPNEIKYYNKDGQLHRLDGPAIVWPRQDIEQWYKDGQRHRVGGPAYEGPRNATGERATAWWQDGQLHRLDGPAREWPNVPGGPGGAKEWWIEGRRYGTEDAFKKKVEELEAQQNLREHFMRFM